MIITSNITAPDVIPAAPAGTLLAAAIDVEWSKNYRVRGGNVPFCYSVAWLPLSGEVVTPGTFGFWYTSAYVHGTDETGDLVASADSALLKILEHADLIAGHQLSSDLAVLAAAVGAPLLGVTAAQVAWRRRGQLLPDGPRLLDTRYDTRHVLQRASRRLVDVCAELRLEVTHSLIHQQLLQRPLFDVPCLVLLEMVDILYSALKNSTLCLFPGSIWHDSPEFVNTFIDIAPPSALHLFLLR